MNGDRAGKLGKIGWIDCTVDNATGIRDFYKDVAGWTTSECAMGDYSDYFMAAPETGETVAGICHARGVNADLPPVWLIYVGVNNLDASLGRCTGLGGQIIAGPKTFGDGRYAVIRDPAGSILGIYEPGS